MLDFEVAQGIGDAPLSHMSGTKLWRYALGFSERQDRL